ncbi:YitT family protein, partial [Paenibacillus sp. MCAF20]
MAEESRVKRRKSREQLSPRTMLVWQIAQLLVGSAIVAVSFNMFMVPNGIASGGVSGLSILVQRLADIT